MMVGGDNNQTNGSSLMEEVLYWLLAGSTQIIDVDFQGNAVFNQVSKIFINDAPFVRLLPLFKVIILYY